MYNLQSPPTYRNSAAHRSLKSHRLVNLWDTKSGHIQERNKGNFLLPLPAFSIVSLTRDSPGRHSTNQTTTSPSSHESLLYHQRQSGLPNPRRCTCERERRFQYGPRSARRDWQPTGSRRAKAMKWSQHGLMRCLLKFFSAV